MGTIKQIYQHIRLYFKFHPKVVCFNCGKKFRLGDKKGRVNHYVIPNQDMILELYFCKWQCHNQRIIDRSHMTTHKLIAEVQG